MKLPPKRKKTPAINRLFSENLENGFKKNFQFISLLVFNFIDQIIHFISHRWVGEVGLSCHFFNASRGKKKIQDKFLFILRKLEIKRQIIVSAYARFTQVAFQLVNVKCSFTTGTMYRKFHCYFNLINTLFYKVK